jgi:DNA-damage-inducible protein J
MIHVRVDEQLKQNATEALDAMGLSVSDAVRVFLTRVAADQAFPFELRVPNVETVQAMEEARAGKLKRFENIDDLMEDLNAGN